MDRFDLIVCVLMWESNGLFFFFINANTVIELGVNETIFTNTFEKWFLFPLSWL